MINSDCLNLFGQQSYETKLALGQIALIQKKTNFQCSLLYQPTFSLELNAANQNFICFPYFSEYQQQVTRATQKLIGFFRSSSVYFNHFLALFCIKIQGTFEKLIFFLVKDEFLSVFSSFYPRRFSKYKIIPSNQKDRKNYNFCMKGNKKKQAPIVKIVKQTEYIPKCIIPCPQGFRIIIGAKPNSKQSKIMEINDEYIGIAIAAPPKEGEANEQLVAFLASVCGVKKNTVYLDKGSKSRHKVAVVENKEMSLLEVYNKMKADMQK